MGAELIFAIAVFLFIYAVLAILVVLVLIEAFIFIHSMWQKGAGSAAATQRQMKKFSVHTAAVPESRTFGRGTLLERAWPNCRPISATRAHWMPVLLRKSGLSSSLRLTFRVRTENYRQRRRMGQSREVHGTGQWYLIARHGDMVMRVLPRMLIGETASGELSFDQSCAQLELDIDDDGGLVLSAIDGHELEWAGGTRCHRERLARHRGAEIRLAHNVLILDTDFVRGCPCAAGNRGRHRARR